MQVSGGDSIIMDNVSTAQTDELLMEVLKKMDSLTTLTLRITEQFDLFMAVCATVLVCVICYVVIYKFTRF